MSTQSLSLPLYAPEPSNFEFRQLVKPPLLIAYGLMANALFWSGLLMPYSANSAIYVAYLHVMCILLGLAMALGGSMATLMIVSRKVDVPYRSLEFAAGMLNISVLTATAAMSLAAYSRGTLALFS